MLGPAGRRSRPTGSGCRTRGRIAVGADADLCVFASDAEFGERIDPTASRTVGS
jgi:hypothetical protein